MASSDDSRPPAPLEGEVLDPEYVRPEPIACPWKPDRGCTTCEEQDVEACPPEPEIIAGEVEPDRSPVNGPEPGEALDRFLKLAADVGFELDPWQRATLDLVFDPARRPELDPLLAAAAERTRARRERDRLLSEWFGDRQPTQPADHYTWSRRGPVPLVVFDEAFTWSPEAAAAIRETEDQSLARALEESPVTKAVREHARRFDQRLDPTREP